MLVKAFRWLSAWLQGVRMAWQNLQIQNLTGATMCSFRLMPVCPKGVGMWMESAPWAAGLAMLKMEIKGPSSFWCLWCSMVQRLCGQPYQLRGPCFCNILRWKKWTARGRHDSHVTRGMWGANLGNWFSPGQWPKCLSQPALALPPACWFWELSCAELDMIGSFVFFSWGMLGLRSLKLSPWNLNSGRCRGDDFHFPIWWVAGNSCWAYEKGPSVQRLQGSPMIREHNCTVWKSQYIKRLRQALQLHILEGLAASCVWPLPYNQAGGVQHLCLQKLYKAVGFDTNLVSTKVCSLWACAMRHFFHWKVAETYEKHIFFVHHMLSL